VVRLTYSILFATAIVGLLSATTLVAQQTAASASDPKGSQPKQATAPPRRGLSVEVSADGKLTMTAVRTPLAAALKEISTQARLSILIDQSLAKDTITSFQTRAVPVDDGLKALLAGYDVFYLFSSDDETAGSIKTVWVYARGQGRTLEPVPAALWASTQELQRHLEDPNPEVRAETFESLIEREGERGLDTALRGLMDPDADVRARTLSSAIDADIEIPAQTLETIILDGTGQTQSMRVLALQAIEARPEAESVASSVANDPDAMVRELARRILAARRPPG
jgi:hypothetical protein